LGTNQHFHTTNLKSLTNSKVVALEHSICTYNART
jgi:hypothetical protein